MNPSRSTHRTDRTEQQSSATEPTKTSSTTSSSEEKTPSLQSPPRMRQVDQAQENYQSLRQSFFGKPEEKITSPRIPSIATEEKSPNSVEDIEKDGALLKNYHLSPSRPRKLERSPTDSVRRAQTFEEELQSLTGSLTRSPEKSEVATSPRGGRSFSAAPQRLEGKGELEKMSEPTLQRPNRLGSVSEALRGGFSRMSRLSLTPKNVEEMTFSEMAAARWTCSKNLKPDAYGLLTSRVLPANLRGMLVKTYLDALDKSLPMGLKDDERERWIKQEVAKHFIAQVLIGKDSEFDRAKIGSMSAVNKYLSKQFNVKVDTLLSTAEDEPSTPRSPRISRSPESTRSMADFRDLLLKDVEALSQNYRQQYSCDLRDLHSDPFIKSVFEANIETPKKSETVTTASNQRTDVTATFLRDFPHSTYEYEDDNGAVKTFDPAVVDDFVKFIGDPKQMGLPKEVSNYACQNLGLFVKNLLFMRTHTNGDSASPLKLFDGTPIAISTTPKATYRFKKHSDGVIEMRYRADYDTKAAIESGKNTARLLLADELKSVTIENATATVTLAVFFHPDGTTRMGTLNLKAEGWNQFNGQFDD